MTTQDITAPAFDADRYDPTRHGRMEIMGREGDTKTMWDRHDPEEVAAAKATFDRFRRKGYLCFSVDKKGEKGEQVTEFDANAERLIFAPQMAGG